jgi:tetratricopeptide (TPR) repeat protein
VKRSAFPPIALVVLFASFSTVHARPRAPSDPPADTCILEIVTHAQATVEVDGNDYGGKRRLTFKPLAPGTEYRTVVTVRFPDGRTYQRPMVLTGGKFLRDTIGPAPVESFDFRDEYAPPPGRVEGTLLKKMPYSVKPWPEAKKRSVRRWLEGVEETAPYLMARATAYRPVRVYLSADAGERVAEVWVDSHSLVVFEQGFAAAEKTSSGAYVLTHELAHLADSPRTISSREDWDRAVRPRIDRIWQAFKSQTGRDAADVWTKAKESGMAKDDSALLDRLAAEQGLPRDYASYAVYEALAECAAAYLWKDYTPPEELQTIFDAHLLSPTYTADRAVRRIHDALTAAEKDDLAGSIEALDEAVAADPTEAWGYLLRGKAREAGRKRDAALEDYTEAVRLNPRLFEALSARGKLLAGLDRSDDAVVDLTRAIELNPLEPSYLLDRASAYRQAKKYDAAIADYGHVIRINPGAVGAIYTRGDILLETSRYQEAAADFSELIKLFDKAPALKAIYGQAYERRARAYTGLNRFEDAIADLGVVLELAPNFLPVYFMRGDIYRTIKKYDEAIADYSLLIEKSPSPPAFIYYHRALCWQAKNEPDKALADFNAALTRDPKNIAVFIDRARLHVRRDDKTAALDDLDQAVKLAPTDPQPYYVRGAVRNSMNDFDGSIADYDKVIELVPDNPEPVYRRGEVYAAKGDFERAIADYTKVLAAAPDHFDALRQRGYARFRKGDYAEAMKDYDRAVERRNDDAELRNLRGRTLAKLDRLDEALADFDRAVELSPKYVWPYVNRAAVYASKGDYRRQIQDLEAAVKIDPQIHTPYVSLAWTYATAPDASVRNGRKAIEAATKACELSRWKEANDLGNLACAYAEAGDFKEAVKWQAKAQELYTPEMREKWGFLLTLYQSGKPYHQEAPAGKSR